MTSVLLVLALFQATTTMPAAEQKASAQTQREHQVSTGARGAPSKMLADRQPASTPGAQAIAKGDKAIPLPEEPSPGKEAGEGPRSAMAEDLQLAGRKSPPRATAPVALPQEPKPLAE